MIRLRNISHSKGGNEILDSINLDIVPGKLVALLGPNGAGKSTLLRIAAGEEEPSQGTVHYDDEAPNSFHPRELALKRAVLCQEPQITFDLRVSELAALGRTPYYRISNAAENEARIANAIDAAGARAISHRMTRTLSGGERRRAHFARVLAQANYGAPINDSSRYLFLDEPTSAMDLAYQHEVMEQSRQLVDAGYGVVVILHDLNLASRYAHEIVLMKSGRIVASGDAATIFTPTHISAVFGLESFIVPHPTLGHPLIVPMGRNNHSQGVA